MDILRGGLYVLLFLCVSLCYYAFGDESSHPERYHDESFPQKMVVFGRIITCGNITQGLFPSKTWTCADISVNGANLAYGYNIGSLGVVECQETKGKHEFATLCRELLSIIGVKTPLWAVYIPKATCGKDPRNRAILTKTSNSEFIWEDREPGYGYIHTIQCMVKHDL